MKRKLIMAILCIMTSLSLSGCLTAREIEHLEYVNSIGIDYKKDKAYFYVQLISFGNIAKQETAARQPEIIAVGQGSGKTLEEAVFNLYETSQQRLAWSQVKNLVFSKEAMKHPDIVREWLDIVDRYYEFRNTVWSFGTDQPFEDLFNTKQILNISSLYTRLNDPKDMYSQNSYIKPLYLYEFIREWNEPGRTILLPVISISRGTWHENKKDHPMYEITGVFPLKNKKYTTFLPREKIFGMRWMEEETIRSPVFFQDNGHAIIEKPKVKIIPSKKNDEISFNIQVEASGYLTRMLNPVSQKTIEKEAADKMEKEIKKTYATGLEQGIDLLNLSHSLYRKDVKAWDHLNEDGYLPLSADSLHDVQVKVKLKHSGLAKSKKHMERIIKKQKEE